MSSSNASLFCFSVYLCVIVRRSASLTTVPLAFSCEFEHEHCCPQAFAAAQLAIYDAQSANGNVIPELGNLVQSIKLEFQVVFDPTSSSGRETFLKEYTAEKLNSNSIPPIAVIGSYYSGYTELISQNCASLGVSQLSWATGIGFRNNSEYANVFRILPTSATEVNALYEFIKLKNINVVACITLRGDVWSSSWYEELLRLCSSGNCKVVKFYIDEPLASTTVMNPDPMKMMMAMRHALQSIRRYGLRTVVYLGRMPKMMLKYAEQIGMAGTKPIASGYIWLFPVAKDFMMAMPDEDFWIGSIATTQKAHGLLMDPVKRFLEHWKNIVPRLRMKDMHGHQLKRNEAYEPTMACHPSAAIAYESVARVRVALENVDLNVSRKPSSGLIGQQWWGTALMEQLQSGVDVHGLARGANLRKSVDIGLPWQENIPALTLTNFVNWHEKTFDLYSFQGGSLLPVGDLDKGIFPGGVSIESAHDSGKSVQRPCSLTNAVLCESMQNFGTCQNEKVAGRSAGWCSCDMDYTGRYCDIQGSLDGAPPTPIHVNLSVEVKKFSGIGVNGQHFLIDVELMYAWSDNRAPWDEGVYSGNEALQLLEELWHPQAFFPDSTQARQETTLQLVRSLDTPGVSTETSLILNTRIRLKHEMAAKFEKFPFDEQLIKLAFGVKDAAVRVNVLPGNLVSVATKENQWNSEWPPVEHDSPIAKNGHWVTMTPSPDGSNQYVIAFAVHRTREVVSLLIMPLVLLEILSWSAFWIRSSELMARFTSGFVTFLAALAFQESATHSMPYHGQVGDVCWFFIFTSVLKLIMMLGVLETILVQFAIQSISSEPGRRIDMACRCAFPTVFSIQLLVLFCLDVPTYVLNVVCHTLLGLLSFALVMYALIEVFYFPELMLWRNIRRSRRGQFVRLKFSELELQNVFDHVTPIGKGKTSTPGTITVEDFCLWMERSNASAREKKDVILPILKRTYGVKRFSFPDFKGEFAACLTEIMLVFHANYRCESSQSLTVIPDHAGADLEVSKLPKDPPSPNGSEKSYCAQEAHRTLSSQTLGRRQMCI